MAVIIAQAQKEMMAMNDGDLNPAKNFEIPQNDNVSRKLRARRPTSIQPRTPCSGLTDRYLESSGR